MLISDLKCIPIQKMVFLKTCGGAPVNSFKPRREPGEHIREDGIVYVNDVCYGSKYPNSHLDIYYADKDRKKNHPTVIYIHGGGFIFGDKVSGDPLAVGTGRDIDFCAELAKKGYNVVSPNYALAPDYRFPVQLEQVDQMLSYLTENQEQYGLDMEHVFLGGGSAGADLSELYGTLLVSPEYAEKIGISPSVRREQIVGLLIDEAALSVRNFEENMNAMLGCWLGTDNPSEKPEIEQLLDPTKWIKDTFIPSFINSSNMQIWFHDSAEDLAAVLEKNGTDFEYFYRGQEYGSLEHGYMQKFQDNACARECYEHMMNFMEKQMKLHFYEKEHIRKLRKAAPECMVLLKSDGSFPMRKPGNIALYGSGARLTIKGGTGSGDVNVRHYTTIEEGLEKAGFTITTKKWLDEYEKVHKEARREFVEKIKEEAKARKVPAIILGMGAVMPEPEYELPFDEEGETAIYVLARISGEGADRNAVPGDFLLTETEIRDIHALSQKYEKFLLVLNVGGVVDLSPVMDIKNILLLSQTGMTIGDSFADVLLGKSYPSGKLTSTWAAWEDYCSVGTFGEEDDTCYREGIYVGYRYFDRTGKTPLFPFGYGLGYTTFFIKNTAVTVNGTKICVSARVQNTGNHDGKEVLQLYVSVPEGKLDQPYQTLAAFVKTGNLRPGEEKNVSCEFNLEDLASFESERAGEILEAGDYVLRLGNSSRNTHICGIVRLDKEIKVKQLTHIGGNAGFEEWIPEKNSWLYPEERTELEKAVVYIVKAEDHPEALIMIPDAAPKSTLEAASEATPEISSLIKTLSDSELAYLCVGGFQEKGSKSVIGNAGMSVAGAAGETTNRLLEKGIPALVMADGPAGLRLSRQYAVDEKGVYAVGDEIPAAFLEFMDEAALTALGTGKMDQEERHGEIHDQYCSAIPIGTALAQSWNPELCEMCGDIVGEEMERFGIHLWLAPALNIHRSPLCGRNFEYYSEDPLISGKMAAGITRGVQKHSGCGVTVKHFVCNNQETNRFHSNSIVKERALRDIYLKGFQIVIQEARPRALMTSYNLLNGEHTSQRRDLNVTVLRHEWGFTGIAMSDWVTPGIAVGKTFKYPYACASGSIRAGNDLMMPGTQLDHDDLMGALNAPEKKYSITRENLEECAAHVIALAQKLAKKKES